MVQPRPADDNRQFFPHHNAINYFSAVSTKLTGAEMLIRENFIDKMMLDFFQFIRRRFCRSDGEQSIDLPGICGKNFGRCAAGNF